MTAPDQPADTAPVLEGTDVSADPAALDTQDVPATSDPEQLTDEETTGLRRLQTLLEGDLGRSLVGLVAEDEVATTVRRVSRLLARGAFPAPASSAYPVIPWPPF